MNEKPPGTRGADATTTRRGARSIYSKIAARTAAEVCQRFDPGEGARALLKPELTPRKYLALLMEKGEEREAVRFLAYGLSKPEAIWWGIRCAREVGHPAPTPEAASALETASRWLMEPTDENRRAALPAAQKAGVETAAGCVALGVFFSGGSLGPASLPPFPPEEHLTARVIAGGVILAAATSEPEMTRERLEACLDAGIEIARGSSRWSDKG
jgi:hypothetical protein